MVFGAIKDFITNEDAGTLTLTAVIFPLLLGFGGLGLDVTGWYMNKRSAQNLVDMAAIDAVHSGHYFVEDELEDSLNNFLADKGLEAERDTLTVNSPPLEGDYAGRNGFYEIVLRREVPLNFVNAFYVALGEEASVFVSSRAVAGTLIIGTQCIVALDETADRALDFSGTANVVADCGVAANSTSGEAIYVGGNANLTADPAMAVGDIVVSGGATLTTNSPLQTFSEPTIDPYNSLDVPPNSACDFTGTTNVGDDEILSPGRYCGDLNIQGQNITFEPGTYVIDEGDFISNANSQFAGDGVTFVLTGGTDESVGTVNMNGNTTADLTAPTSGTYEGILFYQDQRSDYRSTMARFNGGSNLLFDGVIYFPSGDITFNGGASADPSCLQIFGATVTFNGNSNIGNEDAICTSMNLEVSPQVRIQLVE